MKVLKEASTQLPSQSLDDALSILREIQVSSHPTQGENRRLPPPLPSPKKVNNTPREKEPAHLPPPPENRVSPPSPPPMPMPMPAPSPTLPTSIPTMDKLSILKQLVLSIDRPAGLNAFLSSVEYEQSQPGRTIRERVKEARAEEFGGGGVGERNVTRAEVLDLVERTRMEEWENLSFTEKERFVRSERANSVSESMSS